MGGNVSLVGATSWGCCRSRSNSNKLTPLGSASQDKLKLDVVRGRRDTMAQSRRAAVSAVKVQKLMSRADVASLFGDLDTDGDGCACTARAVKAEPSNTA